jgi:hypothetical protein
MLRDDCLNIGIRLGHAKRTIERAAESLGASTNDKERRGQAYWELPAVDLNGPDDASPKLH